MAVDYAASSRNSIIPDIANPCTWPAYLPSPSSTCQRRRLGELPQTALADAGTAVVLYELTLSRFYQSGVKLSMTGWQGFYSSSQVSRLAGVPLRTLYNWRSKGIIAPSVQVIGQGVKVEEGYSYADLAIAKLLRGLRDQKFESPVSRSYIATSVYPIWSSNKCRLARCPRFCHGQLGVRH